MSTVVDNAAGRAGELVAGIWTREHALRHCEGYIVDGPRGHLGYVSEVLETDDSLDLLVAGAAGELRIPVHAIRYFDPHAELIVVADTVR